MQLCWQQFLLIFQITNVIFCTKKQPWYRTAGPIPHTGQRPMRSFSPEAVATTALWKSVPMLQRIIRTEPDVDKNIRSVCTPPAPLKSQKRTCNIIFLLKLNDKKYNFKFQWSNRYHIPTEVYIACLQYPPTVTYLTYHISGSTLTAVGRSQLLARWPGTHSRISYGIQRAAQTVLCVYLLVGGVAQW